MIGSRPRRSAAPVVGFLAVAGIVLAGGCARPQDLSPPLSNPAPEAVGSPTRPVCPAEGVRIEPGVVDAAMGLRALGITLINCGQETYRVNGYPAIRAQDEDHEALDIQVLKGVEEISGALPTVAGPPLPVTLRPGQQAGAVIVWRNTYDDTRHPPVNAEFLAVAPLSGRPFQLITPEGGLDLGSTGRLGVSPWKPLPSAAASQNNPPVPGPTASDPVETDGPLL